jgi:hypothetical protein
VKARPGDGARFFACGYEFEEALAGRFPGQPVQLAAAKVLHDGRQLGRLDHDDEREARTLTSRLPKGGIAFELRIEGFGSQVVRRHHAQHMVGGVMALLHPGIDVFTRPDLPFVNVSRVAERIQLLGDPERPVAVARRVADEIVGHAPLPGARS